REPMGEMPFLDTRYDHVLEHRIAGKLAAVEQDRAPELLHPVEMFRPRCDALGKDRTEQIVFLDRRVEAVDQVRYELLVHAQRDRFCTLRRARGHDLIAGSFDGRRRFHRCDSDRGISNTCLVRLPIKAIFHIPVSMQLSLKTDYVLRILMVLAATGEVRSVDWIAEYYGISRNHLAKVAQHLAGAGFVGTVRGRSGGLHLALPPDR